MLKPQSDVFIVLPSAELLLRRTKAVLYLYDPWVGKSLFQNRPLAEVVGYSAEQIAEIGNSWRELMHPEDILRFARHRDKLKKLRGDQEAQFEFRLRDPQGNWRWFVSHDTQYQADPAGRTAVVVGHATDISRQKQAESRLELFVDELAHRARNFHAMIQAIVTMTFRKTGKHQFLDAVNARLGALSQANDMLVRNNWRGLPLAEVVALALKPHFQNGLVSLNGDTIDLRSRSTSALALVLNELATNAVKYGCLRSANGRIEITVGCGTDGCDIVWRESGGEPIGAPGPAGFGTRLITEMLADVGGSAAFDWPAEGLVCTISLPGDAFRPPLN
ncbi:MAG: HWE histidine kinase domain-containing protein [Sphingomonadaceae bacterium]